MAIRFSYNRSLRLVIACYSGRYADDQSYRLSKGIISELTGGGLSYVIADLTDLESSSVTGEQMFTQAQKTILPLQGTDQVMKIAVVAPSDQAFGTARMFKGFADMSANIEVVLVETRQAAIRELGLLADEDQLFEGGDWTYIPASE